MTMYVLTDGATTVLQYPYTRKEWQNDNPNVSFPKNPDAADLATFNIYPVIVLSEPVYDPATHYLVIDSIPTWSGTQWELGFTVTAFTQGELDNIARKNATIAFDGSAATELATVNLDDLKQLAAVLVALIEIRAYQANNTNPTPAIDKLSTVWSITKGDTVNRILNRYGPILANVVEDFGIREDIIDPQP